MVRVTVNGRNFELNELYQPLYGRPDKGKRASDDRLSAILHADEYYANRESIPGAEVLDFGCNVGYFSLSLADAGAKVVGIDNYSAAIQVANALAGTRANPRFVLGDLAAALQQKFTTLLALSVFHHVGGPPHFDWINWPKTVVDLITRADFVYLELATWEEALASWAPRLKRNAGENPFIFYWRKLEESFPDYVVRLLDVFSTHIGTRRPLFFLKRKQKTELAIEGKQYLVYDRFKESYWRKGAGTAEYYFAERGGKHYFLKYDQGKWKVSPKINGYNLWDLMRTGIIHYYNKKEIFEQYLDLFNAVPDPMPWNFMVDLSNLALVPIDLEGGIEANSKKLVWNLVKCFGGVK